MASAADSFTSLQSDPYLTYSVEKPTDANYVCQVTSGTTNSSFAESSFIVNFEEQVFNVFIAFVFQSTKVYSFSSGFAIISSNDHEDGAPCLGIAAIARSSCAISIPPTYYHMLNMQFHCAVTMIQFEEERAMISLLFDSPPDARILPV